MTRIVAMVLVLGLLIGCGSSGDHFTVDDQQIRLIKATFPEDNRDQAFSISGEGFAGALQLQAGCGASAFSIDDRYEAAIVAGTATVPVTVTWERITSLAALVSAAQIERLPLGVHDLQVTGPSGYTEVAPGAIVVVGVDEPDTDTFDTGTAQGTDTFEPGTEPGTDTFDTGTGQGTDTFDTGTEPGTDTFDTGTAPGSDTGVCIAGETACYDSSRLQTCGIDGLWLPAVACPAGCSNGACDPLSGKTVTAQNTAGALITVDGHLDEAIWSLDEPVDNLVYGVVDNQVTFDALWDDERLYLAARVTDNTLHNDSVDPWDDDSVEVYIDGGNEKSVAYDTNDNRYIHIYGRNTLWVARGTGLNVEHDMLNWGIYYIFEFSVPWSDLGISPVSGRSIGFDIRINDDDDGNGAEGALIWNGDETASTTPAVFGNLLLVDQSAYPTVPVANSCGNSWQRSTDQELNTPILIKWDDLSNTLSGWPDTDCTAGNPDLFLWVYVPPYAQIQLGLQSGFDQVILRTVSVPEACPDVYCYPTKVPTQTLSLVGSDVGMWTRVVISAVNPTPGAMTIIDLSSK